MISTTSGSRSELPPIDERLAAPETHIEVIDGKAVTVAPADEPHAERHGALAALLRAHRAGGYSVAIDMLTRTSLMDDVAPDASVYPAARDPVTGRRRLEELAFEIAAAESLGRVAAKAAKLAERGVRRIFAIDVDRARALEWDQGASQWVILDRRDDIEDPALAVPLPIAAMIDAAQADDAIARALRARRHPEFAAEREEGRAEGLASALLVVLEARGLAPTAEERRHILAERERARLERWLAQAPTCASVASLLAGV